MIKKINTKLDDISNYTFNIINNIGYGLVRISGNIVRLIVIGIIINIISYYFYPDFPERFPTIYAWFDGWLQFGEFVYKVALKGIYSIFTGTFSEFMTSAQAELTALWSQFVTWLSQITF